MDKKPSDGKPGPIGTCMAESGRKMQTQDMEQKCR